VAAGRFWAPRTSNSEYRPLKEVVLGLPDPDQAPHADPDAVQHLRPVNYARAEHQLSTLAHCYEQLGITVHVTRVERTSEGATCSPDLAGHNLMFARDLFFMTPGGAVIARMGSEVRAGEPRHLARTLSALDVPILCTIHGDGTLEGADVLWAREDVVLVGVGNRTNASGARQAAACLAEMGVRTVEIPLPRRVQHLLGLVQIVDRDLAVVRGELLDDTVRDQLSSFGLSLVPLPEHPDVTHGLGMNVVCVSPRTVVMPAGAPFVRDALLRAGIDVAAQVDVDELLAAAGGIGCATGILVRETPTPQAD
jgi:N-dimethylarginine dimethylaminohydrolase